MGTKGAVGHGLWEQGRGFGFCRAGSRFLSKLEESEKVNYELTDPWKHPEILGGE